MVLVLVVSPENGICAQNEQNSGREHHDSLPHWEASPCGSHSTIFTNRALLSCHSFPCRCLPCCAISTGKARDIVSTRTAMVRCTKLDGLLFFLSENTENCQ